MVEFPRLDSWSPVLADIVLCAGKVACGALDWDGESPTRPGWPLSLSPPADPLCLETPARRQRSRASFWSCFHRRVSSEHRGIWSFLRAARTFGTCTQCQHVTVTRGAESRVPRRAGTLAVPSEGHADWSGSLVGHMDPAASALEHLWQGWERRKR